MGISSAGGGGNTVRNMMVDDRSGLTADEEFDVYPYVEELTSRLIAGSATSNAHIGWEVFDFLPEKDLYRAA